MMNKWKIILLKLLYPHIVIVIISTLLGTASLVYSFGYSDALSILQYCSYVISAYALLVICFRVPKAIKRIKEYKKENRYILRYASDRELRVKISLCVSVSANLIYAAFNVFMGYINQSVWFYSFAGYYILLTLMRGLLLNDTHRKDGLSMISQWRRYRSCGALLIAMNMVLLGMVFYIVYQNKGVTYNFVQAIAMAAYTFTITTVAIVNAVRYRKSKQPLLSAVKFIGLAAALVSMLSLENAMLNVFGEADSEGFRRLMTAITGGVVWGIILIMGIYMVIKSTRYITENKI